MRSALGGSRRGAEGGHRADVSDDDHGKPCILGDCHEEGPGGGVWGGRHKEASNLDSWEGIDVTGSMWCDEGNRWWFYGQGVGVEADTKQARG